MSRTYLTREGYEKMRKELADMQAQRRKLSEEVGKARELGDLRENAEYHAAREKLAQLVSRMAEMETKLADVQILDGLEVEADTVRIGAIVTIQEAGSKEQSTYTLVGPDEANPSQGRISVQSPIGKALLGHKVSDKVDIVLPRGGYTVKILKVSRG